VGRSTQAKPIRIGTQAKMLNSPIGVVVIDKPAGMSSHAVVSRARRTLGMKKIGHAGTLDPDATGVLVLGVGQATRLLGYLTRDDKGYVATVRLGQSTDTDDAQGNQTAAESTASLTQAQIEAAFASNVGTINQVPSSVSAVKVDGKRAYARVRAGEQVELEPRTVTIHELRLGQVTRGSDTVDVEIHVRCSAGTYIRAIARDTGALLGVGGHLTSLCRTTSGAFTLAEAQSLSEWEKLTPVEAAKLLMSPAEAASRSLPVCQIDSDTALAISHGTRIPWPGDTLSATATALVHNQRLLAIGESIEGRLHYCAVFPSG